MKKDNLINNISSINNITVIGTGAWGTAIAKVLSESGNNVTMFGIDTKEVKDINDYGMNKKYFSSNKINTIIRATDQICSSLEDVHYIVLAVPSANLKNVLRNIKKSLKTKAIFINLVKGLDPLTKKPWSYTIQKIMKEKSRGVASLIGPSFAIDVFMKKPTIVNIVSNNKKILKEITPLFNVSYFKVVVCKDEVGAELIGALKNLLAIGIGVAYENHQSINTISAILTQGIKEIELIVIKNGGDSDTILEFCGIGDIFLTCTSDLSRNFSFGKNVYKKGVTKAILTNKGTVEGYTLFPIVNKMIDKKTNLPVFKSICNLLSNKLKPIDFVSNCFELINK